MAITRSQQARQMYNGGDAVGGSGGSGAAAGNAGNGRGEREGLMPIAPKKPDPIMMDKPDRNKMPLWMQLGYSSQDEYDQATGLGGMRFRFMADGGIMSPAAVQPQQTLDLNKMAYRFMADGGFLDDTDEARQAYGLGSVVKKAFKTVRKPFKAVTKAVKKVAKSPIGRIALAVAAPYALGPAMAPYMASLSATQQAMLLSAATTGITQVASGEDLDFKQIALSAALSGATAKAFPAGGAQATGASKAASAPFTRPTMADVGVTNMPSVSAAPSVSAVPRSIRGIQDYGSAINVSSPVQASASTSASTAFRPPTMKDVGVTSMPSVKPTFSERLLAPVRRSLTRGLASIKDSKLTDVLLRNKDKEFSPLKGILLASTLAGLATAKGVGQEEPEEMDRGEGIDIAAIRRSPFDYLAPRFAGSEFDFYGTSAAEGGRIGYDEAGAVLSKKQMKKIAKDPLYKGFKKMFSIDPELAKGNKAYADKFDTFKQIYNQGFQEGGKAEPVAKKIMPLIDMDGMEKDYRETGGFVPIGRMEKADDVPARLSKNEFVFTADAVRNAGDGDVDKGAEVMYNMMKNLEAGGDVSEESQGLEGARRMFQTSQRLEEVL